MLDRFGTYTRFVSCFPVHTSAALAEILKIDVSAVLQWKALKRQIPWEWLKIVVDTQVISWDWLLEGVEPKISPYRIGKRPTALNPRLINKRFFAQFPDMSQAQIAKEVGVSQTSVYRWHKGTIIVKRECLKHAVDQKGTTWEWLLEGRK